MWVEGLRVFRVIGAFRVNGVSSLVKFIECAVLPPCRVKKSGTGLPSILRALSCGAYFRRDPRRSVPRDGKSPPYFSNLFTAILAARVSLAKSGWLIDFLCIALWSRRFGRYLSLIALY